MVRETPRGCRLSEGISNLSVATGVRCEVRTDRVPVGDPDRQGSIPGTGRIFPRDDGGLMADLWRERWRMGEVRARGCVIEGAIRYGVAYRDTLGVLAVEPGALWPAGGSPGVRIASSGQVKSGLPLNVAHDPERVVTWIGYGLEVSGDNRELRVRAAVPETPAGEAALEGVRTGARAGLSMEFVSRGEDRNPRTGLRFIWDAAVWGFGLVP